MHISHYAPKARVLMDGIASTGQGLFALDEVPTPEGVVRIGSPLDVIEFAHDFYAALRAADRLELKVIVVIPPKGEGLAEAILERILKAAAGRKIL
jgi:L-threonylcarbamoyladenylate synthase